MWAKDLFKKVFHERVLPASLYLAGLDLPGENPVEEMESVKEALVTQRPSSFNDCVLWARKYWQQKFHNDIVQFLYTFPLEFGYQKISGKNLSLRSVIFTNNPDTNFLLKIGEEWWPEGVAHPRSVTFDVDNNRHIEFIVAAANLMAHIYQIPKNWNKEVCSIYLFY